MLVEGLTTISLSGSMIGMAELPGTGRIAVNSSGDFSSHSIVSRSGGFSSSALTMRSFCGR